MVKQEDIISQVRDRGFCVAHDWLNANDIKRLRSMVTRNGTSKADATGIYTETISGLIKRFYLGIVKLEYSYIQHAFDSAFLIYISRKYGIKRLAKNILGVNNVIGFPDGYISPKSDEFAAHWHVDQAYGGKERIENPVPHNKYFIKFFF